MENVLIEYPKCSTCQKAKKFLEENNIKYVSRHIVTDTPTFDEISEWISRSELPLNKFFNSSGMLYRSMNLKEELKECSEEDKIRLLASNGMLIKRPILITPNRIFLGFKEEEWSTLK